jgi:hypothetical protein
MRGVTGGVRGVTGGATDTAADRDTIDPPREHALAVSPETAMLAVRSALVGEDEPAQRQPVEEGELDVAEE